MIRDRIAALIKKRDLGEHLAAFHTDPVIAGFFDELEQEFIEQILQCKVSQDKERLQLSVAINAIRQLRQSLMVAVKVGERAQVKLVEADRKASNNE